MVCGKSTQNISFNQFYIVGYSNSLLPCLKLLVIIFIFKKYAYNIFKELGFENFKNL